VARGKAGIPILVFIGSDSEVASSLKKSQKLKVVPKLRGGHSWNSIEGKKKERRAGFLTRKDWEPL